MTTSRSRWFESSKDVRIFQSWAEAIRSLSTESMYFSVDARDGGEPLDFHWDYRGFNTTIVLFHAAINPAKVATIPVFLGRQISDRLAANRLFVSDPALFSSDRVTIGWFMGTKKWPHYQKQLTQMLLHLSRSFGQDRLILFGPSAGGFASLYFSSLLPRSVAVAVNPQVSIKEHNGPAILSLVQDAWGINHGLYDPLRFVPAVSDVVDIYSRPTLNSVIYIQNRQDTPHYEKHYSVFKKAMNPSNSFRPIVGSWGQGHVPPPRKLISGLLTDLCAGKSLTDVHTAFR